MISIHRPAYASERSILDQRESCNRSHDRMIRSARDAFSMTILFRCSGLLRSAGDMDDAKILRDLFDGTGVMSALDHSKIEGANNPEALNIDAQAARIARKAAEALKRSRQVCQVCSAPRHISEKEPDTQHPWEMSPGKLRCTQRRKQYLPLKVSFLMVCCVGMAYMGIQQVVLSHRSFPRFSFA